MKLRELFENVYQIQDDTQPFDGALKTVGVCYGRWNPPHKGHKAVWQAASKNPVWYVGTNESTEGPKDPLPYEVKLQAMALVWPKVAQHVIPEQSLMTLASRIYEEHGENVQLNVYTDEEWLYKALNQYNGVEGKPHGFYKFTQIDWKKTQRLASATNLRAAVRANDPATFYRDAGVPPNSKITIGEKAYPMFELVAHYLNKYPEKVSKPAVAEAKQAKMSNRQQQSTAGVNLVSDGEKWNGDYTMYRLGLAVAGTDGDIEPEMSASSWIGKWKSTHPYTPEEQQMLKKAYKAVGANYKDLNSGDMKSKELDHVNTVSTVAKPKRNKYGV